MRDEHYKGYRGDTPGFTYRVKVGWKNMPDGSLKTFRWSIHNRQWVEVDIQLADRWAIEDKIDIIPGGEIKPLRFE